MLTLQPHIEKRSSSKRLKRVSRKRPSPIEYLDLAPWPEWGSQFEKTFGHAVEKYLAGSHGVEAVFSPEQVDFLVSIGNTPQEIYDFVEDWCELGEPSFGTALRIAEVRAEYFFMEQYAPGTSEVLSPGFIPSGEAELGGFVWLPRIIAKARAKLRGELPLDMMYSCQNDRTFLKGVGIDPAQFLRVVWRAGEDIDQILEYVTISSEFHQLMG